MRVGTKSPRTRSRRRSKPSASPSCTTRVEVRPGALPIHALFASLALTQTSPPRAPDDAPSPIRPRSLTPALYPPPTTPPIAKEHLFIPPRTLASPNGPDDAWPLVDLPSYRPEEASAAPAPLYAEGAAGRNESVGEKLESHGMLEALGEEFVTDDEGGIVRRDGGRGR